MNSDELQTEDETRDGRWNEYAIAAQNWRFLFGAEFVIMGFAVTLTSALLAGYFGILAEAEKTEKIGGAQFLVIIGMPLLGIIVLFIFNVIHECIRL